MISLSLYQVVEEMSPEEVTQILKDVAAGSLHPRDAKAKLAFEITACYHLKKAAEDAAQEFDRVFKSKGLPEEIKTIHLSQKEIGILDLLKETGLVPSKMEARRLISQGGVKLDSEKINDEKLMVRLEKPVLIQCGKRKFIRVHSSS